MSINNLLCKVTFPGGMKLTNGAQLQQDTSMEVLGPMSPFYSTVLMVKQAGGIYLRRLNDITIAQQIYWDSSYADAISYSGTPPLPPSGDIASNAFVRYRLFIQTRMRYVTARSTRQLILNTAELLKRGSKTLGNFSVDYREPRGTSAINDKLTALNKEETDLQRSVETGGIITPGGTNLPMVVAPMAWNFNEEHPGRRWVTTGMGANSKQISYLTDDGSQNAPVKFASGIYSYWYFTVNKPITGLPTNLI